MYSKQCFDVKNILIDNSEIDAYTRVVEILDNCLEFKFNVHLLFLVEFKFY